MIVLDKSYLEGAPTRVVRALCAQRTVIFPETLLFELLTTDNDPAASFRKLPNRDNPVRLLSNCKALLDYETAHNQACGPLQQHFIKEGFRFNQRLSIPGSPIFEVNEAMIAEWKAAVEQSSSAFFMISTSVSEILPEVRGHVAGSNPVLIAALERRVAADADLVRSVFARVRGANDPRPEVIDPRWAWFRYVQTSLLRSLNFTHRFGDRGRPSSKPAFNDYLDIEYCVAAVLARGFATNDGSLGSMFRLLCPHGELRTLPKKPN